MTDVLSQRALNRATLARQNLLERAPAPAIDMIEHLGGMQSQAPLAPYVGLWTRLQDFAPDELSALTEERQVVRLSLMRNTEHLVSARDCLGWRPLFYPLHAAEFQAHYRSGTEGVDRDALVRQAKQLLEEQPRTRGELAKLLAERWPEADPGVLAYAVTHHVALCQVPPRGIWGKNGPAVWALVESWLNAPLRPVPVEALVVRYLGAFGPATVADIQVWSGLTRLREVVERLPLRTFRGEAGQALHDLPDAPRPAEDIPAPPRSCPNTTTCCCRTKTAPECSPTTGLCRSRRATAQRLAPSWSTACGKAPGRFATGHYASSRLPTFGARTGTRC
nr:winged helix DNA-binding domain-containing protein [Trebonia kvetii]